jgi:hypothetical protein
LGQQIFNGFTAGKGRSGLVVCMAGGSPHCHKRSKLLASANALANMTARAPHVSGRFWPFGSKSIAASIKGILKNGVTVGGVLPI